MKVKDDLTKALLSALAKMRLKIGPLTLTLQWDAEVEVPSQITGADLFESLQSALDSDPELRGLTRAWVDNAEVNEQIAASAYRMGVEFCQDHLNQSIITEEESSRFSAYFKP